MVQNRSLKRRKTRTKKKGVAKTRFANEKNIKTLSQMSQQELLTNFGISEFGLTNSEYQRLAEKYGPNQIEKQHFA